MEQKPSVGRIVHYAWQGIHSAAIVVHVWTDTVVNLTVFNANGDSVAKTSVPFDDGQRDATWHWPERV